MCTDPGAVASETKLEADKRIDYKKAVGLLMQMDRHEPVPKTKEHAVELLTWSHFYAHLFVEILRFAASLIN